MIARQLIDPILEERLLVDVCLADAQMLKLLRAAYLERLAGAEPSLEHLPKLAEPADFTLPSLRSSGLALAALPVAGLDIEIAAQRDGGVLERAIHDASVYYKTKQYEADAFAAGKALHRVIAADHPLFGARVCLQAALDAWVATLAPPDTSSWSPERHAVEELLTAARELMRLNGRDPYPDAEMEAHLKHLDAVWNRLKDIEPDRFLTPFRHAADRFHAVAHMAWLFANPIQQVDLHQSFATLVRTARDALRAERTVATPA